MSFLYNFGFKYPEITEVFFSSQRYRGSMILHISIVWSVSPNLEDLAGWTGTGGKMLCLKGVLCIIVHS